MTSQTLISRSPELLFQDFLISYNHPLGEQINCDSTKFHRFKCPNGCKTDACYKFYSDGIPAGYFKCWHCGIEANFCSKQEHEVDPDEWLAHKNRLAINKQQDELEIKQKQADVARLANAVFSSADAESAAKHGYLCLKQVKNYGLRVVINDDENTKKAKCFQGTLLIPSHNSDRSIVNIERIYFDKSEGRYQKRPLTHGQRNAAFYCIGELGDTNGPIYLCEGYSTAATVYESIGERGMSVASFNCGNLSYVAQALREMYPNANILIAADLDPSNIGEKYAKKASNLVGGRLCLPDFSNIPGGFQPDIKRSDFNDLFLLLMAQGIPRIEALALVQKQLANCPKLHNQILGELIKKVTHLDFRELAGIPEDKNLKNSHYQIIAIEQILELARSNQWGICKNYDFVYVYNSEYWSLVDEDELKTFLGDASEAMGVNKFNARYFNFRDQLYKQFIALANLPKPAQQENTILINLKNGTFEITPNGTKLNRFNPVNFMTYQLPFEYAPEATAPIFESYLARVLPEQALQDILAEYLGYVFIRSGTLKLEKTLLLYGMGANGKSVFYEVVRRLFGEQNTSEYSLQNLTNDNGYYRAMIANKLVNYASEINGKLEASVFKQLVSGEPVEARLPYGKPFTITQYAKLIFNCNELPKDVEQTEAYFRRFLIIPFEITIPEAEQDKQLANKIITNELSGVFNWVLRGLNRLLTQRNFTESETVKRIREQYEKESDSVKLFLDDKSYQPSPTEYVAINKIYPAYRIFCQDNGFHPVNQTNFIKRLERSKIIIDRKNIGKVAFITNSYKSFG